jgi:hypothetical protein
MKVSMMSVSTSANRFTCVMFLIVGMGLEPQDSGMRGRDSSKPNALWPCVASDGGSFHHFP